MNDEFTESFITNNEVLEANQSGSYPKLSFHKDDQVVWYSKAKDGRYYLALFNIGERENGHIRYSIGDWIKGEYFSTRFVE